MVQFCLLELGNKWLKWLEKRNGETRIVEGRIEKLHAAMAMYSVMESACRSGSDREEGRGCRELLVGKISVCSICR